MSLLELKKFGVLDIALLVIFVIYLVFPISTPQWLVPFIDSPIGLVVMFAVAVSLFVYKNPVLGVLFVLVSYEILRRNHYIPPASPIALETQYLANRVPQTIPTQAEKDAELNAMNPPVAKTLEEEIIAHRSPIGKSEVPTFVQSSFYPVSDKSELPMTKF